MRLVNLDAEKYGEFLRCLSVFKDDCNDVDVRNGMIRQRTNDKASVIEMNLNNMIPEISLPISNLKQKIELLKTFAGNEVSIEVDDENFKFSDQFSSLRFKIPRLDYMDNRFISDEDLANSFTLDESDLVLNTTISKNISDRVKIITQGFNVNSIQVVFSGDSAMFTAATQSKDQFAKFLDGIVTDRSMDCITSIITSPFVIDHDTDTEARMYNIRENDVVTKFSTNIGEIAIVIYTKSKLVDNVEE